MLNTRNISLKYSFCYKLLSNLTENEIQKNLLDTVYNDFIELEFRKAKIVPSTHSPSTAVNLRHKHFFTVNNNYDHVINQLEVKFTPKEPKKFIEDKSYVGLEKTDITEIKNKLELILERNLSKNIKTPKNKLVELIHYLSTLLIRYKGFPNDITYWIYSILNRFETLSKELLELKEFKKNNITIGYQKILTEEKDPIQLKRKIEESALHDFYNISAACHIGKVIDDYYQLIKNFPSKRKIVNIIIDAFTIIKSEGKTSYQFYMDILCGQIEIYTKNTVDLKSNTIHRKIVRILVSGLNQLQVYSNSDITDWRYFKYTFLSQLLSDQSFNEAIENIDFFKYYRSWLASKDFPQLANVAKEIIRFYRDKSNIYYVEKRLIRMANAVLNFTFSKENGMGKDFISELNSNTKDNIKTNSILKEKDIYSCLHNKTSPHYFFVISPEDNEFLKDLHIDYIKSLAGRKISTYKEKRENSLFYFIYDLFYKGDFGDNTKRSRLSRVSSIQKAINSTKNYNNLKQLVDSVALSFNAISDNTSQFKLELRTISYRIYKLLDKVSGYSEEAKNIGILILEKIFNASIAEIFGNSEMRAYPDTRKTLNITDSFMGIITKLKFKAKNIFNETEYRQDSVNEFYYIKKIHVHLSCEEFGKFKNNDDLPEFYTILFELMAEATANISNINVIDKIGQVRTILLKLFKPLHDPKIEAVTLLFSPFQQQRIRDSLNHQIERKLTQSILNNHEMNLKQFKENLSVELHSQLLAKVVLSTGDVARKPDDIDSVLQLGQNASKAIAATNNILGYAVSGATKLAKIEYDQHQLRHNREFADLAANPTMREELVELIVEKVAERYYFQITNIVHAIDTKKLAAFIAKRILFQARVSDSTNLDMISEEFAHNIWRYPKFHNGHGLWDETVLSQTSSSLKISKLCTRPSVAIQVTGFSENSKVDILQFYHRSLHKDKTEKYGYVTHTAEFKLVILKTEDIPSLNGSNTYYLQLVDNKYTLRHSSNINLIIDIFEVDGLKDLLNSIKIDEDKIIHCLATYHGRKCAESFELSFQEKENDIQFQENLEDTLLCLSDQLHTQEQKKQIEKQKEIVRFFHYKLVEKNEEPSEVTKQINLTI